MRIRYFRVVAAELCFRSILPTRSLGRGIHSFHPALYQIYHPNDIPACLVASLCAPWTTSTLRHRVTCPNLYVYPHQKYKTKKCVRNPHHPRFCSTPNPLLQLPTMPSSYKSPTPSPKSSPKIIHASLPSLPHHPSSEPSTTTKISSPLNPSSKRSTPLSSSPSMGGIEGRLRVDSTASTARSPSPSRVEALSRPANVNSLQRGRSSSPYSDRARSLSRGRDSRTPELATNPWGDRELPARPWVKPPKKKTIPPEQSERWAVTRQVCDSHL